MFCYTSRHAQWVLTSLHHHYIIITSSPRFKNPKNWQKLWSHSWTVFSVFTKTFETSFVSEKTPCLCITSSADHAHPMTTPTSKQTWKKSNSSLLMIITSYWWRRGVWWRHHFLVMTVRCVMTSSLPRDGDKVCDDIITSSWWRLGVWWCHHFLFMVARCVMTSLLLDGGEVSLQLRELGSVFRVVLPAALHHFIYIVRATLRTCHPVT